MFKKGSKVFYPYHGIGKIDDVFTREFGGKKEKYYSINFVDENLKMMVPVDKADDLGLRKFLTEEEVEALLEVLKKRASEPREKDVDRSYFLHMIGSLDIFDVAKGVCELLCKRETTGLKRDEDELLKRGIDILNGLIVCSKKVKPAEARKMIIDYWKKGLNKKKKS